MESVEYSTNFPPARYLAEVSTDHDWIGLDQD